VKVFALDKLRLGKLPKVGGDDAEHSWPGYLFGGRIRTSTVVLIVAFAALWWIYDYHRHSTESSTTPTQVPATQVVPPGFVPDPNYTWVPRSRLQQPPVTVTETWTQTITPTTTPPPPPTTTEPPPPFGLPPIVLPPPFGPPATTTTPPPPGQGLEPPDAPPSPAQVPGPPVVAPPR
jgi:hypothetical protein